MRLSEMLQALSRISKIHKLPEPYLVGGVPRDRSFGMPANIKDLDITTGDDSSITLGLGAARTWPDASFRIFDDGHSSLQFKNIKLDFSNNFNLPGIEKELKSMGIEEPTDLQKEMYSRDFTINTLLQPMDLKQEPIDVTGSGLDDIKNKILRSPVNPELTIGYDPRRILRGLRLSIKYGLAIDGDLRDAMIKYRGSLKGVPLNQIKKQVNQMLRLNSDMAIELLTKYKLLPIIPLSKLLTKEVTKRRLIQNLLEDGRL